MLVIGLTGGIGAGKSTVADLFAAKGVPVIDADVIAKELTLPNHSAFAAIVAHFGDHILHSDGTLNRRSLREIIFKQAEERRWLEGLLHPLILARIQADISKLTAPYCIAVIPLLTEVVSCDFIDRVLVVDANKEAQIKRVAERDQAHPEHVAAILQSQVSREQRLAIADDVILNNNDRTELAAQVEKLHQFYSQASS